MAGSSAARVQTRIMRWPLLSSARHQRSRIYKFATSGCARNRRIECFTLKTLCFTERTPVHLQVQKVTRRCHKELEPEIITEEMRQRADEYNQKHRELRKKGPDGRQRARELWESVGRGLVDEMLERAEKKGPAGLVFLEGWLEEKVREHGKERSRKVKTISLVKEGLAKAYLRERLSALAL